MTEVITRDALPKRPYPGLVICYSYLWFREAQKKQIEGLKNRCGYRKLKRGRNGGEVRQGWRVNL
jgi:hypothetical protein